ncbi:hypothetical protein VTJ49DRAFT_6993 [Mycothermus thermophilus]|uniref:Uncharacterized protein n=1 Tax=Humicola insolens TaxID=85995 RepID=A0ABR3VIV4_HUMIN
MADMQENTATPSTSRAHETNNNSTNSSNSLVLAALQAPPLETLASDTHRTHRTWTPSYGCVQRCDLCNERARGVLQACTECSRRLCQKCVEKRIWWEDRRHYIDPAACDWVIRKRPRAQKPQNDPAAEDAAPPRRRRKLERSQAPAAEHGSDSSSRGQASPPHPSAPRRGQTSDNSAPADSHMDGARRVAAGALLRMRERPVQGETVGSSLGVEGDAPAAGHVPSPRGEEGDREGLISEVYSWIYGDRPRLDPRRPRTQIPDLPLQGHSAGNTHPREYGEGPYGAEGGPSTSHGPQGSAYAAHSPPRPDVSEIRPVFSTDNPTTSLRTDIFRPDAQISQTAGHDSAIQPAGAEAHAVPPRSVQAYSYNHGYNTFPPVHVRNEHELDFQTLSDMRRAWNMNPTLLRMRLQEAREQYSGSSAAAALHALGLLWDVFETRRANLGGALPVGLNLETVRWFMHERDVYAGLAGRGVGHHGQQHGSQLAPPHHGYYHPPAYNPHYQQPYHYPQVQPAYQFPPEHRHNHGYSLSGSSGQRHPLPSRPLSQQAREAQQAQQPHRPEHKKPDEPVRDKSMAMMKEKQPQHDQDPDSPRHLQRLRLPFHGTPSKAVATASDPTASTAFSTAARTPRPVLPAQPVTPGTSAAAVEEEEGGSDEPPVIVISDDSDGVKEDEKGNDEENKEDKMDGVTYP